MNTKLQITTTLTAWLMMSLHKYPQIPSLPIVTSSVVKDIPSRAKLRCAQSASDSLSLFSPSLS